VQNRAVIPSAKRFADLIERRFRESTREIHRHLSWKSDIGRASFTGHIGQTHVEMLRHFLLNLLDRNRLPAFLLQNVFQQMLDHFLRERFAA